VVRQNDIRGKAREGAGIEGLLTLYRNLKHLFNKLKIMGITKIIIENFKTFDKIEINLDQYNVLIGANASGKSNFIQIFKFIRDISTYGLNNAIYMQGGVEFIRNSNLGISRNLIIQIDTESKDKGLFSIGTSKDDYLFMRDFRSTYRFELKFKKTRANFDIINDKFDITGKIFGINKKSLEGPRSLKDKEFVEKGESTITIKNTNQKITREYYGPLEINQDELYPPIFDKQLKKGTILIEHDTFSYGYFAIHKDISIFDFDPKIPKKAIPISGKAELAEDGGNLALVLKSILENESKRRKFLNHLKFLMPIVDNIRVKPFSDKSLLFEMREVFNKRHLPASLISDGTINLISLIIALYFDRNSVVILEEPEKNIHPYLISRVVKLLRDASENKQIIVTTHDPEVIKYTKIENILLMCRDKKGFSKISRPKDDKTLEIFIKNNIGVDELFIKQLLEPRK